MLAKVKGYLSLCLRLKMELDRSEETSEKLKVKLRSFH